MKANWWIILGYFTCLTGMGIGYALIVQHRYEFRSFDPKDPTPPSLFVRYGLEV